MLATQTCINSLSNYDRLSEVLRFFINNQKYAAENKSQHNTNRKIIRQAKSFFEQGLSKTETAIKCGLTLDQLKELSIL